MTDRAAEKVSGIVLRCDADGLIEEIAADRLGMENCARRGAPFIELVDQASRQKAEAFLTALREQHTAFGWEMNIVCEDGKIEPAHFAGAKDDADDGGESFFIAGAKTKTGMARLLDEFQPQTVGTSAGESDRPISLPFDLTEQTERDSRFFDELSRLNNELATVQRELAKKNIELERLNAQKNQFLGIAAHDLRNPLSVILNYSSFLLEDAAENLSAEHLNYIAKIQASSRFMLSLVSDFLDHSKIEAGRLEIDREPTDAGELARRAAGHISVPANEKRIRIVLDIPENLPAVRLDELKIEQVLNNLLGNAVKFSPPGSVVELSVELRENDRIVFSVKDQGPGIAPEDAGTLFAPFVKGKTRATGGEKSAGLGLAIVKRIVETHGGDIAFETEAGKGATFIVSLPVK